jgi:aryl-alcohol dehydrogenase-like predicted oxidoreductase
VMRYRKLGNTGIDVSEVGFGTWGIGGRTDDGPNSYGATDDDISLEALQRAFELGINFFDSSNIYGYGHAEELLARAFGKVRGKVVIASKVGFVKHGGPWQIDPKYVRAELEKTLKRLGADYLDLYQLHSPPIEMLKEHPEYVDTFRELKKEGKIRAFGYSVKHPSEGLTAINDFGFEVIQTNFSLIDQRALENGLFDLAREKNIGIIARTPFSFGFLTDTITDLNFPKDDHRSTWPKAQLKLWAQASKLFEYLRDGKDWTAADLALMFCLSFPAVSTVIPGILTPEQAKEDARAGSLPLLSAEEINKAIETYKSHTFFDRSKAAK